MATASFARRRHYHHGVVHLAWGWKRLPSGEIAQTVTTTIRGRGPVTTCTGRTYKTIVEANADVSRLNKGLPR